MDKLVYLVYPVLTVLLLFGAKFCGRGKWNEEFMSLSQVKALQGFLALCIMLHHIGQKTCASWLNPRYIIPGLEVFVPIGYYFVGVFMFCSGYGLYKSYKAKENYFDGFVRKRIVPLILAYYTTGIIFLIARVCMREPMDIRQFLIYLFGLQLSNPNTWYVIAMPFLYAFFYFAFRFCKKENTAMLVLCLLVFLYTLLGTWINHNNWWMRGEWWYNCVHLYSLGLLFAKYEKKILPFLKKCYPFVLILCVLSVIPLYMYSEYAQMKYGYYGEQWHADHIVLRRWATLLSQIAASFAFVVSLFLIGMKVQIGNKILDFMGSITLEFYLIHGLFLELFAYIFCDVVPSIYYIRNVALLIIVVLVPSIPASILLQKLHGWILGKMKRHSI